MLMKKRISLWQRLAQLVVAAGLVARAAAAETNVVNVSPAQAQKLIAEKQVVVLDLRTPEEFSAGHIAGATNINFRAAGFEQALTGLDKNQSYLVHCASGNRSTQALPKFQQLEFKSLYHMNSGFKGWQKVKLPVQ